MTTSLDAVWRQLESSSNFGGSIRISDDPADNFFCYLDATGRRGLLLITDIEPPRPAAFHAVDVVVGQRADGRWSVVIVLKVPTLTELFRLLCTDLVTASHDLDRSEVARFILARLLRWRRLLEAGDAGLLTLPQVRGLMGEILFMRECFRCWPAAEVVEAWVGPLDAPQDFALPSMRIEVKTLMPTSPRATITSVDQLDVTDGTDLRLAVVRLANVPSESTDGLSPPALVAEIRQVLDELPEANREFDSRLISAGYVDNPAYDTLRFRLDDLRIYRVRTGFPRLTRHQLPAGVSDASYEIELSACAAFESGLERHNHGH